LDTLEKLEAKVDLILGRVKELEEKNKELESKNETLEKDLKTCRLELQQAREVNTELKSGMKDKEVKVQDKISALLGKLEEVEAEIA
jgi:FtsZ-binding cell division protein ZapB